jgi:hypothetical protein
MGQFTAYVFQEEGQYRIVIDGLGSDTALSLFEAEDAARRLIERHVRASYPDRGPVAPTDALGAMNFQLEIIRSDGSRERRELWLHARIPLGGRKTRTHSRKNV